MEILNELGQAVSTVKNEIINVWNEYHQLFLFCYSVWCAGAFFQLIGSSSIIGHIISGILLKKGGIMVHDLELLQHLGHIGMGMLLFESGSHISLRKMKSMFWKSFSVAIIGDVLSWSSCVGMIYACTGRLEYIAACAMIPTSIAVSSQVLSRRKKMDSVYGQLILSSAFIDDVLGIFILALTTDTRGKIVDIALKAVSCILFIFVSMYLSHALPINEFLAKFKTNHVRDSVLLSMIFTCMALFWFTSPITGSILLGQFCAGIVFSNVYQTRRCWKYKVKTIRTWLLRVFFTVNIGYSIPFEHLLDTTSLGYGASIALVTGILAKLCSSLFVKKYKYVVGASMIPRGEFSLIMLKSYFSLGIIDAEIMACITWAVLLTLFVSPIIIRHAIKYTSSRVTCSEENRYHKYLLTLKGKEHKSIHLDILEAIEQLNMNIQSTTSFKEDGLLTQHLTLELHSCPLKNEDIRLHVIKTIGNPDQEIKVENINV